MSHFRCTGNFIQGKAEARFIESLCHVHHHLILVRQRRQRRCTPLLRYFGKFEQNADFYMLNADQDTLKAARVDDKLNRFLSFRFCRGTKLDHSGKKRDSVRISQLTARASKALFFSSYRNYNSPSELSQSYPLIQYFRVTAFAHRMFSTLVSLKKDVQKHNIDCLRKSRILCIRIKFSASGHR